MADTDTGMSKYALRSPLMRMSVRNPRSSAPAVAAGERLWRSRSCSANTRRLHRCHGGDAEEEDFKLLDDQVQNYKARAHEEQVPLRVEIKEKKVDRKKGLFYFISGKKSLRRNSTKARTLKNEEILARACQGSKSQPMSPQLRQDSLDDPHEATAKAIGQNIAKLQELQDQYQFLSLETAEDGKALKQAIAVQCLSTDLLSLNLAYLDYQSALADLSSDLHVDEREVVKLASQLGFGSHLLFKRVHPRAVAKLQRQSREQVDKGESTIANHEE